MSLTYWNRRRREAADAEALRDPQAVAEAAEATAGAGGTEGVEGHTGTTVTADSTPLGAPDSSGIDTGGKTHEDAAQEAEGAAQGPETQGTLATPAPEKPSNGASTEAWREWALDPRGGGKSEEDLDGLGRDAIRDLFA